MAIGPRWPYAASGGFPSAKARSCSGSIKTTRSNAARTWRTGAHPSGCGIPMPVRYAGIDAADPLDRAPFLCEEKGKLGGGAIGLAAGFCIARSMERYSSGPGIGLQQPSAVRLVDGEVDAELADEL